MQIERISSYRVKLSKKWLVLVFFAGIVVAAAIRPASASEDPRITIKHSLAELQKSPGNDNIRQKIIKEAQAMKPAPATPEAAERFMARGMAAMEMATKQEDFRNAVDQFQKASDAAPWLPNVYYNLGVAQEKAAFYKEAVKSLKLYLFAAPDASDAKEVKNLIYRIEYKQEEAAKEAVQKDKQENMARLIANLNGARFNLDPAATGAVNVSQAGGVHVLEIRGDEAVFGKLSSGTFIRRYSAWLDLKKVYGAGDFRGVGISRCDGGSECPLQINIKNDGKILYTLSRRDPFKDLEFVRVR